MIHLDETNLKLVKKILRFHLENGEKVFAFGSRVTGVRLKSHSDLDLCVKGAEPLPDRVLVGLRDFFAISDLPMRVDVIDWAATAPHFQEIIEKNCEELNFQEKA
jgi:type I restriction enzyme S subunit